MVPVLKISAVTPTPLPARAAFPFSHTHDPQRSGGHSLPHQTWESGHRARGLRITKNLTLMGRCIVRCIGF